MGALPVEGVIGFVVDGRDLVPHASHQLYHLLDGFSLSCGFGFGFCFGLGFGFGCKSLACKEGICKLEQLLEVEGRSWLLVGTLVKEVRAEHSAVVGMKALPEEGIALPNRHSVQKSGPVRFFDPNWA